MTISKYEKERTLKEKILRDCYQEVDGFWVYGPLNFQGYLNEHYLLMIVKVLQELNKPYDEQIKKYFNEYK